MKTKLMLLLAILTVSIQSQTYPIVDTGVKDFYSNKAIISEPSITEDYYGQDANYIINEPSYTDNGDGTITDNVTRLVWQQNMGEKITYDDAFVKADSMTLGGETDWRVPTLKELYSLMLFSGSVQGETAIELFIDTTYFDQLIGDTALGEREIDAQTWCSTQYEGVTMGSDTTVFGVNFIDGRIKGYPKYQPGNVNVKKSMYFRMVRGNTAYGINNFSDNGDGTITDNATGLMWQQSDDGNSYDWEEALYMAKNLEYAGHDDWRVPSAKELQSIVDYTRSPQTTSSAAIDPIFNTTEIDDPEGNPGQYPYFWTSSSHLDGANPYSSAVYIAFGEAQGEMNDELVDVHGAGAQRSDPKSGDADDYPEYWGPQGDVRYVYNYVRCVRTVDEDDDVTTSTKSDNKKELNVYPNPISDFISIQLDQEYENILVTLTDINGKVSLSQQFANLSLVQLNVETYDKGIYFLEVAFDNDVLRKVVTIIE